KYLDRPPRAISLNVLGPQVLNELLQRITGCHQPTYQQLPLMRGGSHISPKIGSSNRQQLRCLRQNQHSHQAAVADDALPDACTCLISVARYALPFLPFCAHGIACRSTGVTKPPVETFGALSDATVTLMTSDPTPSSMATSCTVHNGTFVLRSTRCTPFWSLFGLTSLPTMNCTRDVSIINRISASKANSQQTSRVIGTPL